MGDAIEVKIQAPESGVMPPVPEVKVERPAWLPEKFKTPEDMAKSYGELEKKFTETNQGKKTETPVTPPTGDKPATPPVDGKLTLNDQAALTKAGLDLNALEQEFVTNGNKLSEASAQKLKDAGIDQAKMETYQRGRVAQWADYEAAITKDIKGGRPTLDKATEWAGKELTKPEIDAFNKALMAGDPAVAALAAEGLVAKYTRSLGPQLIDGTRPNDMGDVYESRAQKHADMADPRYKTDPAFREKVMNKSLRSDPKH